MGFTVSGWFVGEYSSDSEATTLKCTEVNKFLPTRNVYFGDTDFMGIKQHRTMILQHASQFATSNALFKEEGTRSQPPFPILLPPS